MKITTAGSLGNVSQPLVEQLIAAGHELTVITSNNDRKSAIEALGARVAVGSITDAQFLTEAFTGADAVYTMTPPAMGENIIANIARAGEAYAEAIRRSGVKRVVVLSSIGADAAEGTGPVKGVHLVEQTFKQLSNINITFVRAGNFYYNYLRDIPLIKNRHILGNNFSGDSRLALAHPRDIASAIANELQLPGKGIDIKYVVSAISTGAEVAAILGAAIDEPQLPWVEFSDDDLRQALQNAQLPDELTALIIEMGQAQRNGRLTKDFFDSGATITGTTTLAQFAEEFKSAYEK